MQFISRYSSPLGEILMASDGESLLGLWFEGQKYFARTLEPENREHESQIFPMAKKWLDIYFSGKEPGFKVPIRLGGTRFQNEVWEILCTVSYGRTVSYGEIARELEKRHGKRISAQAVGGAVGRNNISLIVPCHRVICADGSLGGYAGGVDRKEKLLRLERACFRHMPKTSE